MTRRVNEGRQWQIPIYIWHRKHRSIGHVLRYDRFLQRRRKQTTGRRIQMLHDLANDDDFVALKRAAEDREGWRYGEKM